MTKLYETGTHPSLEKLRRQVPVGVFELFAIRGLRPDKIFKIYEAMFEQLAQCVDQIEKKLNGSAQQQIEQAAQKLQSHLG